MVYKIITNITHVLSYLNIFQLCVLSFFTKYKKKNLYLTKMGLIEYMSVEFKVWDAGKTE